MLTLGSKISSAGSLKSVYRLQYCLYIYIYCIYSVYILYRYCLYNIVYSTVYSTQYPRLIFTQALLKLLCTTNSFNSPDVTPTHNITSMSHPPTQQWSGEVEKIPEPLRLGFEIFAKLTLKYRPQGCLIHQSWNTDS